MGLWSFACRHHGFYAITFVLVNHPSRFFNTNILGTEESFGLIWGIITLPVFKQETPRCKNGVYCFLYMESFGTCFVFAIDRCSFYTG
jgi:hypothetical protein